MPNLLNTSSLRVGDADHGLRALLYPNLQGKTFSTAVVARAAGVAGRWARRHAAPAVVGHFIFFRDLAFFGDSENSGFGDTDDDDGRRRNRAPPRPPFFEQKIAKILSPKFFLAILKSTRGAGLGAWSLELRNFTSKGQ